MSALSPAKTDSAFDSLHPLDHAGVLLRLFPVADPHEQNLAVIVSQRIRIALLPNLGDRRVGALIPFQLHDDHRPLRAMGQRQIDQIRKPFSARNSRNLPMPATS